jgi:hypothetical protein
MPAVKASSAAPRQQQLLIETPWNQVAIAWANGKTVFAPLCEVTVRRRQPRTRFITLGANTRTAVPTTH